MSGSGPQDNANSLHSVIVSDASAIKEEEAEFTHGAQSTAVPDCIDLTVSDDEGEVENAGIEENDRHPKKNDGISSFTRHSGRLLEKAAKCKTKETVERDPDEREQENEQQDVISNGQIPPASRAKRPAARRASNDSEKNQKRKNDNGNEDKKKPQANDVSHLKKPVYKVGDRVYAGWSGESKFNIKWYPGVVQGSTIEGTSKFGDILRYAIRYDDGDVEPSLSEAFLMHENEYFLEINFTEEDDAPIKRLTFEGEKDEYALRHGWFFVGDKAFNRLSEAQAAVHSNQGNNNDNPKEKDCKKQNSNNVLPQKRPPPNNEPQKRPPPNNEDKKDNDDSSDDDLFSSDEKCPPPNNEDKEDDDDSSDDDLFSSEDEAHQLAGARKCNKTSEAHASDDESLFSETSFNNQPRQSSNASDDESLFSSCSELAVPNTSPANTATQPKPAPKKKARLQRKQMPNTLATDYVHPPVWREEKDCYYFMLKFGDRMVVREIPFSSGPPKKKFRRNGIKYEILYSELKKRKGKGPVEDSMGQKYFKAYYYAVSGPRLQKQDVNSLLLSIADFENLTYESGAHKTVARLKLMASTSCLAPNAKYCCIHDKLTEEDFEIIDENGHLGCGFIPPKLLVKLLGYSVRAYRTCAIQVRVFSPSLIGIAKGMLMVKDGIERIQIPASMIKVEKSKIEPLHQSVVLNVIGICPSEGNRIMGRILNTSLNDPSDAQKKSLKEPKDSVLNVLHAKGVEKEILANYKFEFMDPSKSRYNHATLHGVADPTGSIPEGYVFVPGMGSQIPHKVFVTRSPCTEAADGVVVNVASASDIPAKSYDFLKNLEFGTLVFSLGKNPLPPKINDGDLDGDLWFVLWDEEILSLTRENKPLPDIKVLKDSNVGTQFQYKMDGQEFDALVIEKIEENPDRYMVQVTTGKREYEMVELTKEEIFEGKLIINRVVDHEPKDKKCSNPFKFCIEWVGGNEEWLTMNDVRKRFSSAEPPRLLWDYANTNGLLKAKGFKWLKKHQATAILDGIVDHREISGGKVEILSKYDDGDTLWENMEEVADGGKLELGKYAKEKQLFECDGWEQARGYWMEAVQDLMCTEQRSSEIDLLTKQLHKKYIDSFEEFGPNDPRPIIWGRAFKQTLEIEKHGGKVELPLNFYLKLTKRGQKYVEIIDCAE